MRAHCGPRGRRCANAAIAGTAGVVRCGQAVDRRFRADAGPRAAGRARRRQSRPGAAGDSQPGGQRDRRAGAHRRSREDADDPHATRRRVHHRIGHRQRRRRGCENRRAHFRCVLHDEIDGNRDGPCDMPLARVRARRPLVACIGSPARRRVSFLASGGRRKRTHVRRRRARDDAERAAVLGSSLVCRRRVAAAYRGAAKDRRALV